MVSTDAAPLCRRCPPVNLQHSAYPFFRLVFEFKYKLSEGKIGDLFTPKVFHAVKVQVFKEHYVKVSTEVYSQFPVVIVKLKCSFFTHRLRLIQVGGVYIPELKQRGFDTEI